MAAALDTYEKIAKETTFDPVNDADLPKLVPLLDAARDLASSAKASSPLLAGFDLSQTEKLRSGASGVYRHALGYALLPRLIWRLEAQMRGYFTQPEFLYEATRVYLMLGGQGPLDKSLVKEWMTYDWQAQYSGAGNLAIVADLQSHLDALLAQPLPAVPLDDALIAKARTTFSRVSLASRAYSRIKPSAAASAKPTRSEASVTSPTSRVTTTKPASSTSRPSPSIEPSASASAKPSRSTTSVASPASRATSPPPSSSPSMPSAVSRRSVVASATMGRAWPSRPTTPISMPSPSTSRST